MYHFDGKECHCTVFSHIVPTLKMIGIHGILIHCEKYFFKHQNFDGISDFYNWKILENFEFFVFVEFQSASQHKIKRFAAECNLLDFFKYLKNTFDLSKMIDVSIRLMDEGEFKCWVEMKIMGDHTNFQLINGWRYWYDLKRKYEHEDEW